MNPLDWLPEIINESEQVALSKIVLTGIITQTESYVSYWLWNSNNHLLMNSVTSNVNFILY